MITTLRPTCKVPNIKVVHIRRILLQNTLKIVCRLVPLFLSLVVNAQTNCSNDADKLFSTRLSHLRDYAARCKQVDPNECAKRQKLFTIEGGPLGEMGNTMITMVHALWMAESNNGILLLPDYLAAPGQTLTNFNLSTLQSCYCIINHAIHSNETALKDIGVGKEVIRHSSGFYYGMFEHYANNQRISDILPPYSDAMLQQIAHTFLTVYSALWAHPTCTILERSAALVLDKLQDSSLSYTAVHKHIGAGDCSSNMFAVFPTANFDPKQLPMKRPEWTTVEHPLCYMTANFTMAVQQQHNRYGTKFFVAFDGKGTVDDYLQIGGIFSTVLGVNDTGMGPDTSKPGWRPKRLDTKFIDMFMSIHSDLAILIPQSTYSLMIFVVRVVLGKETVPISYTTDLFANTKDRMAKFGWPAWVSWGMIADQYAKETGQIQVPIKNSTWELPIVKKAAAAAAGAAVGMPVESLIIQAKGNATEDEIALKTSNDKLTNLTKQYAELMAAKKAVDEQHDILEAQDKKHTAEIAALKKQLTDLSTAKARTDKEIQHLKMQQQPPQPHTGVHSPVEFPRNTPQLAFSQQQQQQQQQQKQQQQKQQQQQPPPQQRQQPQPQQQQQQQQH